MEFNCPFCGTRHPVVNGGAYCSDCDRNFKAEDVTGKVGSEWSARVTVLTMEKEIKHG